MRAITANVTPSATQAIVRMDNYATAVLGAQIVCSGGAQFSLLHSHDDPNDLVNPASIGGAVVSSTWSAADAATTVGITLSNGNLTASCAAGSGNWQTIRNTAGKTAGKLYVEFLFNNIGTSGFQFEGLANAGFPAIGGNYLGAANYSAGIGQGSNNVSAGFTSNYTVPQTPATGDVWALAVDFGAGNVWIAQNNVWLNSSNPATAALPILSFVPATVGALFAAVTGFYHAGDSVTLQPTAGSQKYAPPNGFAPWDGTGGSMTWDNSLLPAAAQSGGTSMSFQIMACPLYFQLNLTNGQGSVRATFLQVGEHSHSNISKGPFSPGSIPAIAGSNFAAMGGS